MYLVMMTVHYIDKLSWEQKSAVLERLPFNEKHTGKNISVVLINAIWKYGLHSKIHAVVRDHAVKILKAMQIGRFYFIGCLSYMR